MTRCSGSVSTAIIEVLFSTGTSAMPGQAGSTARAPTLMKIFGAVSVSPSTSIVCAPVKRAWPQTSVRFAVAPIHFARPSTDSATTPSLRAFTAFMSTLTGAPMCTP